MIWALVKDLGALAFDSAIYISLEGFIYYTGELHRSNRTKC